MESSPKNSNRKWENGTAILYVILQYEHHLLLQSLQRGQQAGLDLTVVVLMVNLSRSHKQDILIMQFEDFQWSFCVTLFGLVSLFICRQGGGGIIFCHYEYTDILYTPQKNLYVPSMWKFYCLEKSGLPTFVGFLVLPLSLSFISHCLPVAVLKPLQLCLGHLGQHTHTDRKCMVQGQVFLRGVTCVVKRCFMSTI